MILMKIESFFCLRNKIVANGFHLKNLSTHWLIKIYRKWKMSKIIISFYVNMLKYNKKSWKIPKR